jgi:TonB family protein
MKGSMFALPKLSGVMSRRSFALSSGLHCLVLLVLVLAERPMLVKTTTTGSGLGVYRAQASQSITYLANPEPPVVEKPKLLAPRVNHPPVHRDLLVQAASETQALDTGSLARSSGSLPGAPIAGYEARPALPIVFPDPPRFSLPQGITGDVIVEVTIDVEGKVAETKVLASLGEDIDGPVLAALRNWRFTPAMVNGVAVLSRQDVHFHFPS